MSSLQGESARIPGAGEGAAEAAGAGEAAAGAAGAGEVAAGATGAGDGVCPCASAARLVTARTDPNRRADANDMVVPLVRALERIARGNNGRPAVAIAIAAEHVVVDHADRQDPADRDARASAEAVLVCATVADEPVRVVR